jgi:hypothetical protein
MDDAPILICYDGSGGSRRAIDPAAALLSDTVSGGAFEELNVDEASTRAIEGALPPARSYCLRWR